MFNRSKYILTADGEPIIFSELQQHFYVAANLFPGKKIIGAGFVTIDSDGKYSCYGESISLKVKSRGEEDSKKLNKMLGVTYE